MILIFNLKNIKTIGHAVFELFNDIFIRLDDPNCWRIYAKKRYEDNYELYKKQKELEFKIFKVREDNERLEEENRNLREELEKNVETIEDGRLLADYVQVIFLKFK